MLIRVTAPVLFLLCFLLMNPIAMAQEASPAAGTAVAEPMVCTAEPRDLDQILALWFGPSGAPAATPVMAEPFASDAALPEGERADDATIAAIIETTRSWVYCIEVAGKFARGFSYVTDDLLAQFGPDITNPAQDTPEEVRAALEAQLLGTPIAGEASGNRMPQLAGPRKERILEDERAAAIWSFGGDKVFFIYERQGDRWLIDEAIDIIEGTATPTP